MKSQETTKIYDAAPRHMENPRRTSNCPAEAVREALGLIVCMCAAAIIIAITVKVIMWIL